ncbi:dTMP kinase [Ectothiorhodospira variabilis]|uniref:dTMP kinase n=1 Tax=Ectothiorhodospira variabilis TaxID=505694 RepID=UPI001EFB1BAE|nr:dTMP kinase [Ectothiorhodospira variabilis]MCG5493252.1 dTMP kinase [Ectothiorhodospira variabilis]MCG5502581.1 dTMP kinase [Ectothiorhodospira variabilis]MCG5505653.1 dTMP kinase [Ectothiorhodospira variabilis]
MSKMISIEGLDGAGKSTQVELLLSYMSEHDIPHRFVHFPRMDEDVCGDLISKFLRGEFGAVNEVHPQLVALLFASDRLDFSSSIKSWLTRGFTVLVDRYVNSNVAFQCAKIKDENEKDYLREWIYKLEYSHNGIPRPDLSIFLDAPFEFVRHSLGSVREGYDRSYLLGGGDIHEADLELQKEVRREYLKIADDFGDLHVINCADELGCMQGKMAIHQLIVDLLRQELSWMRP